VRETALLLASELATNAVVNSSSDVDEEIELRAQLLPDRLRVSVIDRALAGRVPSSRNGKHPGPSGLGRRVIEAIAQRWGVESDGGLCVWAELAV
jgi:anti-sigma regulatory factor (Ser/Thr protein kinase)